MSNQTNPKVAILCIGNEVVDGRITNTNASWLSLKLKNHGFQPELVTSCRDDQEEICDILTFLSKRASFIITSGGLGPTTDDLTRHAISDFVNRELVLNEQELGRLKSRFRMRDRKFDNANNIQAHFPEGSEVIPNPLGTAPGFITTTDENQTIYSLPGVPTELYEMTDQTVITDLISRAREDITTPQSSVFQLFGIPESEAGKKVANLKIPEEVIVGYRPHFPELEIRLETTSSEEKLEAAKKLITKELSAFIYSEELNSCIPTATHQILLQHSKTIAVAESCTGGLVGKLLTDQAGSSSFFLGGTLSYSNQVKEQQLDVPREILERHGAVSPEVAIAMATGAAKKFNSDIAVSVTGIAGPDGGSDEKPVGLFYVGIASIGYQKAIKFMMPLNREYVRTYAAYSAIDTVRRFLLGLPYLGKIREI